MTLEQLRIFVAVAERCHVTRAAEALNMAQSAVSAAVSALEGRHGATLFHRVGRGIARTFTRCTDFLARDAARHRRHSARTAEASRLAGCLPGGCIYPWFDARSSSVHLWASLAR